MSAASGPSEKKTAPPVILASASAVRARLLEGAGVPFTQIASDVDENAIKRTFDGSREALAAALADAKALDVAAKHPDALVIGADQVLEFQGKNFDKPADVDEARLRLNTLKGHEHRLLTALSLVKDDEVLWRHFEAPVLVMRDFTQGFLERYLDETGGRALSSVGAYQLEGVGAQLFDRVEGDYFAILGLPLLPLLAALRVEGALYE